MTSVGPEDLALVKAGDGGDPPQVSLAWSGRPSGVWEVVVVECGGAGREVGPGLLPQPVPRPLYVSLR